jgi:hypothetical protein
MSYSVAPGPALVVRHTGQVFSLTQVPVSIGRGSENTIILADPEVSRRHAAISWQAGSYVVEDLGSANGTFVNEKRLSQPQPLRHGHVLRVGGTLFDVQVPSPAAAGQPLLGKTQASPPTPAGGSRRRPTVPVVAGLLLGGFAVVCLATALTLFLLDQGRGRPTLAIQSPREGEEILLGQPTLLQATATGARDITRLDLSVDGIIVTSATSPDTRGQASLSVSQTWTFSQEGPHVVSAVASTARGQVSDPVSHQITVLGPSSSATPTPTLSTTVTPEMSTQTPTPSATQTLTPTASPSPTPTGAPLPTPAIEFFWANPSTITAGECTTLEWGVVTNAVAATIDQGIGGVATPGSQQVCPPETAVYIMTASGPGGATTASATVTVRAAFADLVVESITFVPDPPVQGQDTEVWITIRNAGNGAASAFGWQWQPGTAPAFGGQVAGGLQAGGSTTVTVTWRPDSWYTDLATIARVDVGNTVPESDESNNQLQVNVQVVQPNKVSVTLASQAALDGYVIGGQAAKAGEEIRVGNVPATPEEHLYRGFLSFDLADIPPGATIYGVELRFLQQSIQGSPYDKLGTLVLVHVDYGPSLDVADFDGPELGSTALPALGSPGTYVVVDEPLNTWIRQDLAAGRTRFQLRLQFSSESDGDAAEDYVQLESGDNFFGTGAVPAVRIVYSR